MAINPAERLTTIGMPMEQAKEVARQIAAGGGGGTPVSSDDVTVPAITGGGVTFPGGTLTEALQAIADATAS